MKKNKSIDKEFYEIKIRGVPANVYKVLLEMQDEEHRPSLNNLLVAKLIELAESRDKK